MNERAKQIFNELKADSAELSKSFDVYVKKLSEELEIPEEIAVTIVTDDLVNRYENELILKGLFTKRTLEKLGK